MIPVSVRHDPRPGNPPFLKAFKASPKVSSRLSQRTRVDDTTFLRYINLPKIFFSMSVTARLYG